MGEWISTEVMLPDEDGFYLVTYESDGGKGRHEKKRWVTVSYFQTDRVSRYGTHKAYFAEGFPTAWMYLPEPYETDN